MNKEIKISNIQIKALIVSTTIGIGILSLPNQLVNAMGKDSWITIIISGLLLIPMSVIINKIFEYNPGKDFFEIGDENFGKILFSVVLALYTAYYIITYAYICRLMGELIKGFLLNNTPIQIIIILFIIVNAYLAISEINIIARISYMTYPLIIGFAIILILAAIPGADVSSLLPVFQSDISNSIKCMSVSLFSFAGFEIILFAIPFAEDRKGVLKSSITAVIIITIIYLSLFIITLMRFSVNQIKADPFPLLTIAKLIGLPGFFLQNLDGLIMSLWVILIFSTTSPLYYASGKILSKLFKRKNHTLFIALLSPIIYILAILPKNTLQINIIMSNIVNYLSITITFIIPTILLLLVKFKRRKEE